MSRSNTIAFPSEFPEATSPASSQGLRVTAAGREFLRQRALPWILLSAGLLLALFDPEVTASFAWLPFLVSLFLFGMPHGAMDWTIQNRLDGVHGLLRQAIAFIPYLALMALSTILLIVFPVFTVAAFMVLTTIHFGTADLLATGHGQESLVRRVLFIAGRGCLILGPAFAFHTQSAWKPFGLLVGMGPASPSSIQMVAIISGTLLFVGVLLALSHVVLTFRARPRTALLDLIESALILMLTALASPLFAIGLFFLSTHAYRHSVRLSSDPIAVKDDDPEGVALWSRLLRMHWCSFPLLIPTFVVLPIWAYVQFGSIDPYALVTVTIGFFIITTLPHHLLGLRLPAYRP